LSNQSFQKSKEISTGTFYEFFAGGGMARAGLGEDWRCVFANDICPKKAESYIANWGGDHLWVGDVFKVETQQLKGHVDLAWGSFPCQDLSLAGNGRGLDGERSSAFWGFWRLIKSLNREGRKPKMVILENVYGTLTSHDGKDFEQIGKAMSDEGYRFGAVVVNAVHFVPQSRPRIFIIGVDQSLQMPQQAISELPLPGWHPEALIRAYHRLSKTAKCSWVWWNLPSPSVRVTSLDAIVERQPTGVVWHPVEVTNRIMSMMTEVNRRKVLEAQHSHALKVGTIYKRTRLGIQRAEVRFDGVAGCLRTPAGGSSRQTIMVIDGPHIRTRLISPREMARLMGLSESYQLPTRYNDVYHLMGDGVVVPVVAHLREHILNPIIKANRQLSELRRRA
jgi:DNA (cytosine-5)-methyltransferase 1